MCQINNIKKELIIQLLFYIAQIEEFLLLDISILFEKNIKKE